MDKADAICGRFEISLEVLLEAEAPHVFNAITRDLAAWWGAPYLISPERAVDIVLEPFLGGSLHEVWGGGDGACWAKVIQLKRYELIELMGPLGMDGVVNGRIRFELEEPDDRTLLKLRHLAIGDVNQETERSYREGWKDLLEKRLRAFVEEGEESGLRHVGS